MNSLIEKNSKQAKLSEDWECKSLKTIPKIKTDKDAVIDIKEWFKDCKSAVQ